MRRSWIIRNLHPPALVDRVMVQVDIRGLVEAVVRGNGSGVVVVVVHIGKPVKKRDD